MFEKLFSKGRFLAGTSFSKIYFVKTADGRYRRFFHRKSQADRGVIRQIFVKKDYSLRKMARRDDLLKIYKAIIESKRTPLIIDAGSNIGASVVWFADQFEGSHIVAFEPSAENVKLLKRNTADLDVDIHAAALGSTDGFVSLIDPGMGEWGYQTQDNSKGECKRESLSRLIKEKMAEQYVPFLIKIDIEGGESDLFEAQTEWVDLFPLLIIELHDWMLPRQKTSYTFLKRISQSNRDFVYSGENIFSVKNDD